MKKLFEGKILTIPNLLSCVRLALIPCFVWTYLVAGDPRATVLLLLLSGLTDIADGFIARHFHMISNLGKVLDPLADKLTQGAAAICVARNHPQLFLLFGLMAVKELTQAYIGARSMKQTGQAFSARWYGKACTVITTTCLMIMFAFPKIPEPWINGMLILCAIVMLVTLALYANYFIKSRAAAVPGKEQAS